MANIGDSGAFIFTSVLRVLHICCSHFGGLMPGCEGVECRCCLQGSSSANFPMSEYDISQVQKPATLDMFIVVKLKEAPAMDRAHQKK